MRLVCVFVLCLACGPSGDDGTTDEVSGGSSDTESVETTNTTSFAADQGEVCRSGSDSGGDVDQDCAEGLECCYPCGMEGCDYVCATPQECASWSTLP